MNYKKISIWTYVAVLVACIYSCTSHILTVEKTEYEKEMQKIQYQLDYAAVYSTNISGANAIEEVVVPDNPDNGEKVVYLTFDDGPSARTIEVLDVLKEHNIKATFFIICSEKESDKEIIKRAYDEGHTIAVHTASHSYKQIYKSVDNYLKDFEICFNYIRDITGEDPILFRFPGGSVNNFNKSIRVDLAHELKRRGFTYFDWNVSSGDATKSYSEDSIYKNIVEGCRKHNSSVVLMHDSAGKKETVAALKRALPVLIEEGFIFKELDENAKPVIFKIE